MSATPGRAEYALKLSQLPGVTVQEVRRAAGLTPKPASDDKSERLNLPSIG